MENSKLEYVYVSFMQHIAQPSQHTPLYLGDALDCIKNGQYKKQIEYLRTLDYETYRQKKRSLPTIHFNGTFNKGILENANFAQSSGLFHFDIDGRDPEKLACDKLAIAAIPSCVFCFESPSGKGLKAALRIDPDTVKCDADFKHVFNHAEALLKNHGFIIDKSCKDVRRACFVSYDPEIFVNYEAELFVCPDKPKPTPKLTKPQSKPLALQPNSNVDESFCLSQVEQILSSAGSGYRHSARLKAGRLAGGFIAAGRVNEATMWGCLRQFSDAIAENGVTSSSELKTLRGAVEGGKSEPLYNEKPLQNTVLLPELPPQKIDWETMPPEPMTEEVDDDLLNPPPAMDEAGFYGILKEVVKISTKTSEASSVAVAANFIGSFSAIIGRSAFQNIGDSVCHARPYFLLVGRTGKSRKGTSEYTVRRIFNGVEQILHDDYPHDYPPLKRHEGGLSTGEGLGYAIRDLVKDDEGGGDNGGTDDKRFYTVESEFAGTIAVSNRETNTLSPTIRIAWDGKTIAPLVKNAKWVASAPHIVISGHITSAELIARMSDVDALSGFLNRFVILHIVRPKLEPLPKRTPDGDIECIAVQVAESVRFAAGADVTIGNIKPITLSKESVKYWCAQYRALTTESEGKAGALLVRTEIYARMLAMIFALLDKTDVIEPQHIEAALAWVNYWRDSVQYIFGTLVAKAELERLNEAAGDVLEFIRNHPGCARSAITTGFKHKMNSIQITGVLNHLLNAAPPLLNQKQVPRADGKTGRGSSLFWAM